MFKINGVSIKRPSTFKIERYLVTNLERLGNGTMMGDLIAKKLKFFFSYDAISGAELDLILDAIWETEQLFHILTYTYNGVVKTAEVYVGAIPSDLHHAGRTTNWVWKAVTFNLIER